MDNFENLLAELIAHDEDDQSVSTSDSDSKINETNTIDNIDWLTESNEESHVVEKKNIEEKTEEEDDDLDDFLSIFNKSEDVSDELLENKKDKEEEFRAKRLSNIEDYINHEPDKFITKYPNKQITDGEMSLKDDLFDNGAVGFIEENNTSLINNISKEVVIEEGLTVADLLAKKKKRNKKDLLEGIKAGKRAAKSVSASKQIEQIKARQKKKELYRDEAKKNTGLGKDFKMSKNQLLLMKNLGLKQSELDELVSPKSDLTDKEKLSILNSGYFGNIGIVKKSGLQTRYATLGDKEILQFLGLFRLGSIKTLEIALNKKGSQISKQLNKMENMGLVAREFVLGLNFVWRITSTGFSYIYGDKYNYPKQLSKGSYANAFNIGYVGALLFSNKINLLKLKDYPYYGRVVDGVRVSGEDIVPEWIYRSIYYKELNGEGNVVNTNKRYKKQELRDRAERLWQDWELKGRVGQSPETIPGNEYLYILNPNIPGSESIIIPDIVLKRERNEDGSPNNIAVELEIKSGKTQDYEKRFRGYKEDKRVYSKVIYIVEKKSVAKKLLEAAHNVNFTRLEIVANRNVDGSIKKKTDPYNL